MTTPPHEKPDPWSALPTSGVPGDDELRELAIKRLKQKQAFRMHLFSFVAVNTMLWLIWLVTAISTGGDAWFPWPIFPTLGWGIGVAFNWNATYGPGSRPISENDVDAEMRRLRGE